MTIDEIVEVLVDRRREFGLTQRQVGQAAGIGQTMFCNFEKRMGDPSMRKLMGWADAPGVEIVAVRIDGFVWEVGA